MRLRYILENDLDQQIGQQQMVDASDHPITDPDANKPLSSSELATAAQDMAGGQASSQITDALKQEQDLQQKHQQQRERELQPKFAQFQRGLQDITTQIMNSKAQVDATQQRYDQMGDEAGDLGMLLKDLQTSFRNP